jgi:hypothetical protein
MDGNPILIPVSAPFAQTAWAVNETLRDSEEVLPIVALDLDDAPEAAALFGSLIESEDQPLIVTAEVWVGLEPDAEEEFDRVHQGHPMVRFYLRPDEEAPDAPLRCLSFRVCPRCEHPFFRDAISGGVLSVVSTVPNGVDADSPNLPPGPLLIAEVDGTSLSDVELWAWRYAYAKR